MSGVEYRGGTPGKAESNAAAATAARGADLRNPPERVMNQVVEAFHNRMLNAGMGFAK